MSELGAKAREHRTQSTLAFGEPEELVEAEGWAPPHRRVLGPISQRVTLVCELIIWRRIWDLKASERLGHVKTL